MKNFLKISQKSKIRSESRSKKVHKNLPKMLKSGHLGYLDKGKQGVGRPNIGQRQPTETSQKWAPHGRISLGKGQTQKLSKNFTKMEIPAKTALTRATHIA